MCKSVLAAIILLLIRSGSSWASSCATTARRGQRGMVLTYGMGYTLYRYGPLKQIDKPNVKHLVPIRNPSLDNQWGVRAQPLVYDSVMYVADAKSTVAIDADTGKTLRQFQTGSGINAQPITFTRNGQQHVTVLSGIGGVYWKMAHELVKNVPQGGSTLACALVAVKTYIRTLAARRGAEILAGRVRTKYSRRTEEVP
jgi:PQQ enzyme repeat